MKRSNRLDTFVTIGIVFSMVLVFSSHSFAKKLCSRHDAVSCSSIETKRVVLPEEKTTTFETQMRQLEKDKWFYVELEKPGQIFTFGAKKR